MIPTSFENIGLPLVGLLAALDSVGLPASGDIAVIAAAAESTLPVPGIVLAATAGGLVGDHVAYWVGRLGGRRIAARFLSDERLDTLSARFEGRAGLTLVTGRLLAGLRGKVAFAAGMVHLDYRRFCAWNALGCVIWAIGLTVLADTVGSAVDLPRLLTNASRFALIAVAIVVVALVGRVIWRRRALAKNPGVPE